MERNEKFDAENEGKTCTFSGMRRQEVRGKQPTLKMGIKLIDSVVEGSYTTPHKAGQG